MSARIIKHLAIIKVFFCQMHLFIIYCAFFGIHFSHPTDTPRPGLVHIF